MAAYSYKGIEYEFVNIPNEFLEELQCPICLELVSDPVQTSCGHLFCGKCIEELMKCPTNRTVFTTTPDLFNSRRIRNIKVKCPNKGRGCQWQGNLEDAHKHTSVNCDCQIMLCSNEGCDDGIERRHLVDHMYNKRPERMYKCRFCNIEDRYLNMTTTHHTICEHILLPCPAGCGKLGLVRGNMADHLSEDCPDELVPCTFAIAGCQQIVKRKNLQQHLYDKDEHLDAVLLSHVSLTVLVRDLLYGSTLNIPLSFHPWLQNTPTSYPHPPWVFQMEEFQEKRETNEVYFSGPVYSHFGGYKMCLRVDANGCLSAEDTHVSVFIYLMRGGNDDNLKWPFKGTIKVSLLNQLEDGQHHTSQLSSPNSNIPESSSGCVTEGEISEGWGKAEFVSHEDLDSDNDTRQFLKDDTLFFRVDNIEPALDWPCT